MAFDPVARFVTPLARELPDDVDASPNPGPAQFSRPEGSFAARSFGNVVHACLDILASRNTPATLLAELPAWSKRIGAMLRSDGLPRPTVERLTREALGALERESCAIPTVSGCSHRIHIPVTSLHSLHGLWMEQQ